MATSPDYKAFVLELLSSAFPVTSRNMFGGVGIYAEGLMSALISSEDELYFKVDAHNRADYEAMQSAQFMSMPYFAVPAEVLEDQDALAQWFDKSRAAAKRLALTRKKKAKKT